MSSEVFEGMVSQMRTSPWLASEDLEGLGDVPVVIEAVFRDTDVPMQDGRREKLLYSVKFQGKEKRMVLNATNRKELARAFGARVTAWHGQTVVLYVQDGIRKPGTKGETCKGLRIRAAKPAAKAETKQEA